MLNSIETIASTVTVVIFICGAFNYIVITPLKTLISSLAKVVEGIQRDMQYNDRRRETTDNRITALEVKVEEIEKRCFKEHK